MKETLVWAAILVLAYLVIFGLNTWIGFEKTVLVCLTANWVETIRSSK
jgi:hypothetical protein